VNIGPAEFGVVVVVVVLAIAPLALGVWAIVDAASKPEAAWVATGKNRVTWIVLIAVFTFFCPLVGLVLSIVYLASIRPQLNAAAT
jgi:hypothetical protein